MLEHLLFACCLEDAHYEAAEEAFAALVHTFFDWNEVRVTSISELSEVMACLPDPRAAANRVKRVLHAVFEATFNFDLEDLRKKNLGPTVKWLEKLDGTTRFTVAYVVQAALGGHAIPIDAGTMGVLRLLDLVTDKDVAADLCRAWSGPWPSRRASSSARCSTSWAPTSRPIPTRRTAGDPAANRAGMRGPAAQAAGRTRSGGSRAAEKAAKEAKAADAVWRLPRPRTRSRPRAAEKSSSQKKYTAARRRPPSRRKRKPPPPGTADQDRLDRENPAPDRHP